MSENPDLHIVGDLYLDSDEIEESFIRSPGPGGQKVNKTETAVQVRFNAKESDNVSPAHFLRLKQIAGRRMTKDGIVVITANRFRTQEQNRRDARERLLTLLRQAAEKPKPRRATRPTKASKTRRLNSKNRRGDIKKMRGKVRSID